MAIPLPMRGADITLARITIQQINATTGALTDSSPALIGTITAKLDGYDFDDNVDAVNVSALTSTRTNMVPTEGGAGLTIRELMERPASVLPSGGPVLIKLADTLRQLTLTGATGSYIAKVELSRGNNGIPYFGAYGGFRETMNDKARNIGEMRFLPIDNGLSGAIPQQWTYGAVIT